MRSLLIPLLAAIDFPTAVKADVDPIVAEMCMQAVDFLDSENRTKINLLKSISYF